MKIIKAAYILVIGVLLSTPSVYAMKLAPFPNSKPLQPIPVNVQPNITNNINSDSGQAPTPEAIPQESQNAPTPVQGSSTSDSGSGTYIVYLVAGLAIVSAFFLKARSKK